jgi:hypothetical protein
MTGYGRLARPGSHYIICRQPFPPYVRLGPSSSLTEATVVQTMRLLWSIPRIGLSTIHWHLDESRVQLVSS